MRTRLIQAEMELEQARKHISEKAVSLETLERALADARREAAANKSWAEKTEKLLADARREADGNKAWALKTEATLAEVRRESQGNKEWALKTENLLAESRKQAESNKRWALQTEEFLEQAKSALAERQTAVAALKEKLALASKQARPGPASPSTSSSTRAENANAQDKLRAENTALQRELHGLHARVTFLTEEARRLGAERDALAAELEDASRAFRENSARLEQRVSELCRELAAASEIPVKTMSDASESESRPATATLTIAGQTTGFWRAAAELERERRQTLERLYLRLEHRMAMTQGDLSALQERCHQESSARESLATSVAALRSHAESLAAYGTHLAAFMDALESVRTSAPHLEEMISALRRAYPGSPPPFPGQISSNDSSPDTDNETSPPSPAAGADGTNP